MADLRFEWDEVKNLSNQRKHGVNFLQAAQVFFDPGLVVVQDRVVDGEERWQATGSVDNTLLLLVAHTIRGDDGNEIIRIISARRAQKKERRRYEDENG